MITSMFELGRSVYRSLLAFREKGIMGYDSEIKNPNFARDILEELGNPDKGMDVIIVTGSKGKGSTARMISSLLSNVGMKVGTFTGPHLVHFNERIRVDGKSISDDDFIRIANIVDPITRRMEAKIPQDSYIGPMGILMSMAMQYFKEQEVDIAVMEVGIGAKYDEVNVLDNKWAVITPVLREHLDRIGPTLEDIVENKIAVIKPKTEKVFIGKQTLESMALLRKHLKTKTAIPYMYSKQFKAEDIKVSEIKTTFTLISENRRYARLEVPLVGAFQAENAALAVRVAEEVSGINLTGVDVRESLKHLTWPGRCEIIHYEPMVVVDGTVHRSSVIYLKEWLSKWEFENCSVILSIPDDKDYKGVVEEISTIADRIITTIPDFSPKTYPSDIEDFAFNFVDDVYKTYNLKEALEIANESKPDLILILGTQHIIGNAKRMWGHSLIDLGK